MNAPQVVLPPFIKRLDTGSRDFIRRTGVGAIKKPSPVYFVRVENEHGVEVETEEGVLTARQGDFIAFDQISGHVWPVKPEYVEQHYEELVDA